MTPKAEQLNANGLEYEEQGEPQKAEAAYRFAIAADESWSVPWFNLGLLYKRQKKWLDSFQSNVKATELNAKDEGAWWNLGIAATALEKWEQARQAWKKVGVSIPNGTGPLNLKLLGPVPIRINPEQNPEVVWCDRIDPARGVIQNIPLPESQRRYLDIVLHDGEPKGTRTLHGQEVPVFDELDLLQPSQMKTFESIIRVKKEDDMEQLCDLAFRQGLAAENWSSGIRNLCKHCSEGHPPELQSSSDNLVFNFHIGLAGEYKTAVEQLLKTWTTGGSKREWISLQDLL